MEGIAIREIIVQMLCAGLIAESESEGELEVCLTLEGDACDFEDEAHGDEDAVKDIDEGKTEDTTENITENITDGESGDEAETSETCEENVVLEAETPETETTENEAPEAETPEVETAENEAPESETPEVETAESETAYAEVPEAETIEATTEEADETEAEISVELYIESEKEPPLPSEELLYDYCERMDMPKTAEITRRLLECPERASGEEIRKIALAFGVSPKILSGLLGMCGLEPLRHKSLSDAVFSAVLRKSCKDGAERLSPEEYLEIYSETYGKALELLSEYQCTDDGELVFAPARNELFSITLPCIPEFVNKHARYFTERKAVLLERYNHSMTLLYELYDSKAVNCTWSDAESRYSLRSFLERFCTSFPERNSYAEAMKGVPSRELIVILALYELCLCTENTVSYKGKGKGSKKVTRDLAEAISETESGLYFNPCKYFSRDRGRAFGDAALYAVNDILISNGYLPLNANLRFDGAVMRMLSGLEVQIKKDGRTATAIKNGDKASQYTIDLCEIFGSVPPMLAAVFCEAEKQKVGEDDLPLACKLNEEPYGGRA